MKHNVCCRCGKCCIYHKVEKIVDGLPVWSKEVYRCRFLSGYIGTVTSCRKWNHKHRIGTLIDDHVACGYRDPSVVIPGCTLFPPEI